RRTHEKRLTSRRDGNRRGVVPVVRNLRDAVQDVLVRSSRVQLDRVSVRRRRLGLVVQRPDLRPVAVQGVEVELLRKRRRETTRKLGVQTRQVTTELVREGLDHSELLRRQDKL